MVGNPTAEQLNNVKQDTIQWRAKAKRVMTVDEDGNYVSSSGQSANIDDYKLNGWQEAGPVTYTFNLKTNGKWLIIKYDESAKTVRYANISNNATMTTYDLAVTNYLTLTYDKLEVITDL